MKKFKLIVLAITIVLLFSPTNFSEKPDSNIQEKAKIQNVETVNSSQIITLELNGDLVEVVEDSSQVAIPREFKINQNVYLVPNGIGGYYINDYVRQPALYFLFAVFILTVLFVSGKGGLGAIFGMFFSFLVIFKLILPLIISGFSPILSTLLGTIFIVPVNFVSSHGLKGKTLYAALSTIFTLVIASIVGVFFTKIANISGTASEEVSFLSLQLSENINFHGLFLSGLIISILGVLDDVTISQASIVIELSKKTKSRLEVFRSAMTVGKDHIASLVNTLILVYAGASLPLMMLFLDNSQTINSVINNEFLAEEILQTLVGSIALVLAVPITTFIAVLKIKQSDKKQ